MIKENSFHYSALNLNLKSSARTEKIEAEKYLRVQF